LPAVRSCRDLGITITHDLSSSITDIVAKAHKRGNAILRCFMSRDVDMLTRAYLVYVRPLLEVNSVIWSPRYKQDIDLIERVTPSDNTHRTRDSQQTVCCESRVP